ncbi:AAA domain-containing protein [Kribbella rubisoli]|uniref:AAA domain-containing protein n=1 Tax=Kribbella rubisoli TaxID=3075929 RepID=A0A4Q7X8B0_9ACTN|nr:AAA family ATPase [Kribbella rubisoli]RZU19337.1 AAA domain-containing protein [Kribbella rubisoli]
MTDGPLLIVLTGLPYCGKTTLARALEQEGATVVELDHINRERGFRIEDGVPMAEWPETIRQAEVRIAQSGAEVVVLSWVNPSERDRQRWRDFASARGMRHLVVYLAADQELLDARRSAAVAAPDRHMLSDKVLQRVQRRFQPPTDALVLDATWSTRKQAELVTAAL